MLFSRWLTTSVLGIGCSGPPPTRRSIHVECNHSEIHRHVLHQGLAASFPGDMVQMTALTKVSSQEYVGMFHCCFCPPGHHENDRNADNEDEDWFNVTTWERELTHWAQEIWDDVEHCAIVIDEPHDDVTISSL